VQERRISARRERGHYKTLTFGARLRLSGLVAQKANAAAFEEWAETSLTPTLSKGDIVVMDNLSSYKESRVEQIIRAAGAELRYATLAIKNPTPPA
jgi:transposase